MSAWISNCFSTNLESQQKFVVDKHRLHVEKTRLWWA